MKLLQATNVFFFFHFLFRRFLFERYAFFFCFSATKKSDSPTKRKAHVLLVTEEKFFVCFLFYFIFYEIVYGFCFCMQNISCFNSRPLCDESHLHFFRDFTLLLLDILFVHIFHTAVSFKVEKINRLNAKQAKLTQEKKITV